MRRSLSAGDVLLVYSCVAVSAQPQCVWGAAQLPAHKSVPIMVSHSWKLFVMVSVFVRQGSCDLARTIVGTSMAQVAVAGYSPLAGGTPAPDVNFVP